MKKDIHPKYYPNTKVICACGNKFTVGSTMEKIDIEICSKCHPFFTGKQKFIDASRRIEKFQEKIARSKELKSRIQIKKPRKKLKIPAKGVSAKSGKSKKQVKK